MIGKPTQKRTQLNDGFWYSNQKFSQAEEHEQLNWLILISIPFIKTKALDFTDFEMKEQFSID